MVDKLLKKYCRVVDRWLDQLIEKEKLTNDDILDMIDVFRGFLHFLKLKERLDVLQEKEEHQVDEAN